MTIKFNLNKMTSSALVSNTNESKKHVNFGEKVVFGGDASSTKQTREEITAKYNQRRINLAHLADLINMDNEEYNQELNEIKEDEARELALFVIKK